MNTKNKTYTVSLLILSFSIITLLIVSNNTFITNLDIFINNFFINNQSATISKLMLSITKIGNVYEAFTIFLVFGIFLIIKNVKHFHAFTIATFLGAILPFIIKSLTSRIRPSLLLEQDYSFPSTHATLATIFLLSSLLLIAPHIKRFISKNLFIIIASITFSLVAFSRIYIGVHWTSDVLAGIILGAICFTSCELMSCYKKENVL